VICFTFFAIFTLRGRNDSSNIYLKFNAIHFNFKLKSFFLLNNFFFQIKKKILKDNFSIFPFFIYKNKVLIILIKKKEKKYLIYRIKSK
jgi:hypothetical protein